MITAVPGFFYKEPLAKVPAGLAARHSILASDSTPSSPSSLPARRAYRPEGRLYRVRDRRGLRPGFRLGEPTARKVGRAYS